MGRKDDRVRLFRVVSSENRGGNVRKLKYGKFHLTISKNICYCKDDRTLEPKLWSLHLWRYSKPSEHVPEQSALVDLALRNAVGLNNLQRSLPTSTILCFYDSAR